jgi:PASTA domain-containing protein
MRRSSSRLATAAAVVLGVGVLVVAGRLLPTVPSAQSSSTTAVEVAAPSSSTSTALGILVPQVSGQTLAQARTAMRHAGLSSGAGDQDPQAPYAVVVAQEPPAGARVPPNSPVSFRTRSDAWPNSSPRRLRLGRGPTTAHYRIVAADPMHDPLTVEMTMPRSVNLRVWLQTGLGRRIVLEDTNGSSSCRPVNRQSRCMVAFAALGGEEPGIWTVGVAKRSAQPAAIRVTVTFMRL